MSPTARPEIAGTVPKILVLGGGDVGSAVAHALFLRGARVLIAERSASPHSRRGMAFTDTLFDGSSLLEGVRSQLVESVDAVIACWQRGECLPVTVLAEHLLTAAIAFDVAIDATMRRAATREDLRPLGTLSIGLGPGYAPGANCHIAIETQWGESMGRVLRDCATAARSGGPRALDGVTRERFVIAPESGQWRAVTALGQRVDAGEVIGWLDTQALRAPIAGHLRGLTRDDLAVRAGQRLAEVDPRATPETEGLGERPLAIARGVVEALAGTLDRTVRA